MNEKKSHLNTIESSQNLNLKFKQFKKDIQENLNDEKNDQVIILLAKLITMLADELHIQQKSQIKNFLENNKIDIFYKSYPNIELSLTLSGSNDEKYQEKFFAINQLKNSFLLDNKENIKSLEESEKFRVTSLLNGWIVVGHIMAAMRKENMVDVSEKLLSQKSETFNNFLESEVQSIFPIKLEKRILCYLTLSLWMKKTVLFLKEKTRLTIMSDELKKFLDYLTYIMSVRSFKEDRILLFFIHHFANILFIYSEETLFSLHFQNRYTWSSFYENSKKFLSSFDNAKELEAIIIKMVNFTLEKFNFLIENGKLLTGNNPLCSSCYLHSTMISSYTLNKEILANLNLIDEITPLDLKTPLLLLTECLLLNLLIFSKDKKNKYVSGYKNLSLNSLNETCNRFIGDSLSLSKFLENLSLIRLINKKSSSHYLKLNYVDLYDKQCKNLLDFNTQLSIFKFHLANNQLEFASVQGYLIYILYKNENNNLSLKKFLNFILKFVLLIIQHEKTNAVSILEEIYEKTNSIKDKEAEKYLLKIKIHCLLFFSTKKENASLFKELKEILKKKKTSFLILKADMDYLTFEKNFSTKRIEMIEKEIFSDRIMDLAYCYLCISQSDIHFLKKIDILIEKIVNSTLKNFRLFTP